MRARPTPIALSTSVVLTGALLATLTGCTFGAVQANQKQYDPSDGVGTTVGSVQVRNAVVISDDGETGNLVVSLINQGERSVDLDVTWKDSDGFADRSVKVRAGSTKNLGEPGNQALLENIDAEPGSLLPVVFQYGDNESTELLVPVLDGSLSEYEDYVPSE